MPDESQVRLALADCGRLPEGRPKAQRLESLAAEVRQTGDGPWPPRPNGRPPTWHAVSSW